MKTSVCTRYSHAFTTIRAICQASETRVSLNIFDRTSYSNKRKEKKKQIFLLESVQKKKKNCELFAEERNDVIVEFFFFYIYTQSHFNGFRHCVREAIQ